jgi:hypothetical protein
MNTAAGAPSEVATVSPRSRSGREGASEEPRDLTGAASRRVHGEVEANGGVVVEQVP